MAALLARHGIDVPVIEHEHRLYAGAARNIGIKATRAPYVAFLASDCRATDGWARKRLAAHRTGLAAVGSAMENGEPDNPIAWAAHLYPAGGRQEFGCRDRDGGARLDRSERPRPCGRNQGFGA
jgi:glycosyltransferase involved in cell wall biosynthesis